MKRFLPLFILFSIVKSIEGQQLFIEAGKSISSFNYKNTQGESLDNLHKTNHVFMSLGYRKNIITKNLWLNLSGNYNSYGATGSDIDLDNYYSWDLTCFGLGVGLDYYLYQKKKIGIYLKGAFSTEFMIKGTQTLNKQNYDLKDEEDFDSPFYFFRAGAGAEYKVSNILTFFSQYMYGNGGLYKNNQGHLKINDHRFGIGLFINISRKSTETAVIHSQQSTDTARLNALERQLASNTEKISDLESKNRQVDSLMKQLTDKEKEIQDIKATIARALQPYSGADLIIKDVNGKIYVTLGNDMLFTPGSATLSAAGIDAINNLGNVLADNNDLKVVIEGHTDNRPFKNGSMNNWDLSVKRATSVVEILAKNKNIDSKNLTAAGKGDTEPIADNNTIEGRAKNRRIEVVISPRLDQLTEQIKN